MQFTQAFDLIISLVLIFFLFSTVCSGIMEFINLRLKRRSKYLWNSFQNIFNEEYSTGITWANRIYEHPQIAALKKTELSVGPSYIPSDIFSQVIIELASTGLTIPSGAESGALDQLRLKSFGDGVSQLDSVSEKNVKQLFDTFLSSSSSMTELKTNIQKWYDGYMDRLGGWFKRDSKVWLLFISLAVAISGNINTLRLIDYFEKNDSERGKMVSLASEVINSSDSTFTNPQVDRALGVFVLVDTLGLPIGWKSRKEVGLILNKHLLSKIDTLEKKRKDSLTAIENKFCLYRSCDSCQPTNASKQKCLQAFSCLINKKLPQRTKCDTLFKKDPYKNLVKAYLDARNLSQVQIDSLRKIYENSLKQFEPKGKPSTHVKQATFDHNVGGTAYERLLTLFGWVITAIAGTQGASFWFELLVRFVNVRNNGIKPEKA